MPSPYRESDNSPPAPLEELEWRRRVTRSARWAEPLAAGEMVLLGATQWLPARFALAGAVAWWAIGAALAVATWMYTAPRPRSAVGWRAWLLRGSVPACLAFLGLLLLGMHLEIASYILGVLLVVAAFVYQWPFVRPRRARRLRDWYLELLLYALAGTVWQFLPPIEPGVIFRLCFVFAAMLGASALRRALLPVEQEWWFDNGKAPGEWVALVVYRDQYAQLLFIHGAPAWFATKDEATDWLDYYGYLPAERALAEHLVKQAPPDVLPVARRLKRLRVQESAPRVRVAADADAAGVVDEAAPEAAVEEAEPARAVAVHTLDE